MTRMAISPMLVLFIIGAIVAVILLRKRPAALATLAGLLVAMFVVLSWVRISTVQTAREATLSPPQWVPSDEQLANASVYPSPEAAAHFVGTTLAREIARRTETGLKPASMFVTGAASQPIRATIAAKITDACPYLRLAKSVPLTAPAQITPAPDQLTVTVDDIEDRSGRGERILQATADIPYRTDGSCYAGANAYYENKPWAEKAPGFHQFLPNRPFLVAWSDGPSVSVEEALVKARRSAAGMMVPRVWQRIQLQRPGQQLESGQIQDQIEMMIANRLVQQDRFTQEIGRSYGKLWRAAITVDSSDSAVAFLAGNITSQVKSEQRLFSSRLMSIGALLALIVVVYVLLNAITKGYFSRGLQAGAMIALLIGLLALMLMA